jgi:hypothetical protein
MNNPPAFPVAYGGGRIEGMTLRDYFSARAMQALLSDTDWRLDMDIEDTAKAAYMTADAMMKAREA